MIILLICISIVSILFGIYCYNNKKRYDSEINQINISLLDANKQLELEHKQLLAEYETSKKRRETLTQDLSNLTTSIDKKIFEYNRLTESVDKETARLAQMKKDIDQTYADREQIAQKAFENYFSVLEKAYENADAEHQEMLERLEKAYSDRQYDLMRSVDECQKDLDSLRATRAAAIEAQRKEKEIKENVTFYCLQLSDEDKADIQRLESIKKTLNKPRVLSMLIWQTWYQKPLKALCANILGTSEVTGIYKITNIITNECYIGQAVDVAKRWAEHAKCGLGIDTPAANKLYKSMQEFGLYSFSWELLESCERSQLNEKEKFYIDLYDSYNYGFNSNKGIDK